VKVVCLNDSGTEPLLVEADRPQPLPGRGELLIRVCAAAVTPTELSWYPTSHTKTGERRTGAVPGHEFSGVVTAAGEDARLASIGDEVFGMNDWFADGATAEYCLAADSAVAPKPLRLSHAEAASVPISALTAWQGLIDRGKLQPGERVLVHGGAGGVGIFAIQLARRRGARVSATASARDLAFVESLGAEQAIDYRAERFEVVAREMDLVFDTVGGETLRRSWSMLKASGRMVTIAADAESTGDARVKQAFFIVVPNRGQLAEISRMLDAAQLRAFVGAAVTWSEAAAAYSGKVRRTGPGKLVVVVGNGGGGAI
jgi:NADPH:quinone reductase-like Zn-dependent oxidoreductase